MERERAAIITVGDGLSAFVARQLTSDHLPTLAVPGDDEIREVSAETGAETVLLDTTGSC